MSDAIAHARQGLVIGKFLPPHAGHHHVIERALERSRRVDVVVCDNPGQRPAAPARVEWLSAVHPRARVVRVTDICRHGVEPCPPECSSRWARHLEQAGLGPYDAVFGSEPYIEPFARALVAESVVIDPARDRWPVSGAAVRGDLSHGWNYLHPVVRAGLVRRVVVVGAESTGTTTLARDLARRLGCPWVPEVGRAVSAHKAERAGGIEAVDWTPSDFDQIATAQERLEDVTIIDWVADADRSRPGEHGPLVVCDTDMLATAIWHRRYCATPAPHLAARARARPPALYVLTRPDGVAFVQDGLRDGEHLRATMTRWFEEALAVQPQPWIDVRGLPYERVARVVDALAGLAPLFADGTDDAEPTSSSTC